MTADEKSYKIIDYFGERCSVCETETTNDIRSSVYTAKIVSRREKTGFKEWTTHTTISAIREHPCRICDSCKKKAAIRYGIILGALTVILGAYYFSERNLFGSWKTWQFILPIVIALIASAFINEQVNKWIGSETIAKKKAATIRGFGFTGLDSAEFDDVKEALNQAI
jgi:hypothetical protein